MNRKIKSAENFTNVFFLILFEGNFKSFRILNHYHSYKEKIFKSLGFPAALG